LLELAVSRPREDVACSVAPVEADGGVAAGAAAALLSPIAVIAATVKSFSMDWRIKTLQRKSFRPT